jgi:very-short-patch-repair endonuclease
VRLADLIKPKASKSSGSGWRSAFNQIQNKHVGFVLFGPESLAVKFVLELDDRSHLQKNRVDRDDFLDGALKSAGLQVIRFVAKAGCTA